MIRMMEEGEEERVCAFVRTVFQEFVASLYSQEGVDEFLRYIHPAALAERTGRDHFTLVAEEAGILIGVFEMRNFDHISLLFVEGKEQRKGVASQLVTTGIDIARRERPDLARITVHSSPNAVEAYRALGFEVAAPETVDHGIRYIHMRLTL